MNDNSTNIQTGSGDADDRCERKPLAELKEFDPEKVHTNKVQIQDVTEQARGSGIQIIGGVEPPTPVPETGLVSDDENFWLLLGKGDKHLSFEEHQRAFECYDRALTVLRTVHLPWNPKWDIHDALTGKAKALCRLGRHAEALTCFDEALVLEGVSNDTELTAWQAYTVADKGLALVYAGHREEAMACYRRVITACRRERGGGSSSPLSLLALTLSNVGALCTTTGDYTTAIASYGESLEVHREIAELHRAMKNGTKPELSAEAAFVFSAKSRTLSKMGRFEEAFAAAEEAVKILEPKSEWPDDYYLKLDLSLALLRQGKALAGLYRHAEAGRSFQRSTELAHEVQRRRGTYRGSTDNEA